MNLFGEQKLAVYNCLTGEMSTAAKWPFIIGGGEACDLVLDAPGCECEIAPSGRTYVFSVRSGGSSILLSGGEASEALLKKDANYSLKVGDHLFVFRLTKDPEKWFQSLDSDRWVVHHIPSKVDLGPHAQAEVAKYLPNESSDGRFETAVFLEGARVGFFVESVRHILGEPVALQKEKEISGKGAEQINEEDEELPGGESGSLTCPTCWKHFDPGDVKHVASHEKLKSDPILGPSEMKRFRATRYNDHGVALDPMGIPTMDIACPYCHLKLPPDFLDTEHHIISIVGAPTSGKSYFLSVLTQMLKRTFFKHFGAAFVDADPSANAALTVMRDTLFGAATPAEARLAKTSLEGDMYVRTRRHGRSVMLPKPFIFNIQPEDNGRPAKALTFYDNAGEHFQPNIDQTESPGTLHLAAASGIIFLFDPVFSTEFRARLTGHHDPQFQFSHADIQDTILAEAKVRVKKVLGLGASAKLKTPLAVVVGKLDVWRDLLRDDSLAQPIVGNEFDQNAVDENSEVVRRLMMDVCPQVVASAEAISENVKYFPVSSFGCSPEIIGYSTDAGGRKTPQIGPNPSNISPILVEIPVLWILSQIEPQLVAPRS
jgi:hypothetical protein